MLINPSRLPPRRVIPLDLRTSLYYFETDIEARVLEPVLCLLDGRALPITTPDTLTSVYATLERLSINHHLRTALYHHCETTITLPSSITVALFLDLFELAHLGKLQHLTRRLVRQMMRGGWQADLGPDRWQTVQRRRAGDLYAMSVSPPRSCAGKVNLQARWNGGSFSFGGQSRRSHGGLSRTIPRGV